jgi:hypothetical protein
MRTAHVVIDYKRGTIQVLAADVDHVAAGGGKYLFEQFDAIELTRILDGGTAHDPLRQCGPVPQPTGRL